MTTEIENVSSTPPGNLNGTKSPKAQKYINGGICIVSNCAQKCEHMNAKLTHETKTSERQVPGERMAYTLKETAALLGISYVSAFKLVQRGLLKSSSALRTKIISRSEIERFLTDTAQ